MTLSALPRQNSRSSRNMRSGVLIALAASLALSACASKPDRRGPHSDRSGADRSSSDRGGPDRRAQSSGTFLFPIAALFIDMDTDGDKVTSRAEMQQGIKTEWATFERSPSAVFFNSWIIETLGASDANPNFMSFDDDFNGVVTQSEFSELISGQFRRLDKNKDGQLERSEMITAYAAQMGERSRKSGDRGEERGKGGKGGGRPPR